MKWFVRHPAGNVHGPRAAVGHMPFEGHRTVAEIWAEEAREDETERLIRANRHALQAAWGDRK
jgi:hypothetical protein